MGKVLSVIGVILLVFLMLVNVTPMGRGFINSYIFDVKKVDDATNYKTIKKVEDTCRSMIASYESDKLKYSQYKISDDETKLEWAEQAKMRANNTASTYNNYILENSFVWEDNVPLDIKMNLDYLE